MKVAIIGAGLAGRVLAWRLNELDQGLEITLLEQHDRHYFGTGRIAAAMVAPYTEAVSTDAITQELGETSFALWSRWIPELEAQTQQKIPFNTQGTLVVSHPQDESSWQRFNLKAKHLIPSERITELDLVTLQQTEPELAQNFNKGLLFENEGVINNHALYSALESYIDAAENIQWLENTNVDFNDQIQNGRINIEAINVDFDTVFDCRGNEAKAELNELRSVRGEVISVYAPQVNFTRSIRLMHPRYPLYIAPRGNHEYIIGATQLESNDDGPMTVRSGLELLSALYSLHKGFSEAQILSMKAGLRPTFNDNLPKIITQGKLIHLNGLFRHGYLFTPALVDDLLKSLFDKSKEIKHPQFIPNMNLVS